MVLDCHFMRHVANFWTANEFRPETKTRTRPAISAKPESENRQSVWRGSAKKQDPPHGQKTYRLAQTKPTVSTQSGGGPSEILFPCHFRVAPKLGRRSPIAQFTYCRHSRKILARPSERRASKKMNQLGTSKSPLGRTRIPADVQLGTAFAPSYTRNARANRGRSNFSGAIPNARFRWTTRIYRPASLSVPEPITIAKVKAKESLRVPGVMISALAATGQGRRRREAGAAAPKGYPRRWL